MLEPFQEGEMGFHSRNQDRFFSGLVFLFPLGMASISHYASTLFVLIVLAGCWVCFKKRMNLESDFKLLLIGIALFCGAVLLSLVNSDDLSRGIDHAGKVLYILALYPLLTVARSFSFPLLRPFVNGLIVAGPFNLFIALYSVYGMGFERAQGAYHPIIFGCLMMSGGLFLSVVVISKGAKNRLEKYLLILSMLCFFSASFLSGTRGALLAFPIVFPVLMMLSNSAEKRFHLVKIIIVVSVFCGLFFVAENKNFIFGGERKTIFNIAQLYQGEVANTSLGQRFQMWKIAFEMFRESPLIGSGYGDFSAEVKSRIAEGQTGLTKAYRHAHSIYFDMLGSAGFFGLVTMLFALFVLPFRYFIKLHSVRGTGSIPSVAGVVLVLSFAVFGLTEGWLARSPFVISYIVFTFVLMASSSKQGMNVSTLNR